MKTEIESKFQLLKLKSSAPIAARIEYLKRLMSIKQDR
jgi:hypothetical protein